jgi:UDP-N-acetylmuramoyl-L-alanyl-D-glutamate--2,6-diaminopimelate ligase
MLEDILSFLRNKIIPKRLFKMGQPIYHTLLAYTGAIRYGFPSRKLFIVAVTGTKGKSSVTEIINSILEEAGYKTALSNTIRFKVADKSKANLYKMSMPGRFFMQNFLREAVDAGCTHAVLEITSEGARQYRHKGISLNALVFNNLSPEHIESHGSFEKYRDAKRSIGKALSKSHKHNKIIVANLDDHESAFYLSLKKVEHKIGFALKDAEPFALHENSVEFNFQNTKVTAPLTGLFNVYNALAAATVAQAMGISTDTITSALAKLSPIKGRVERVQAGQGFDVIVDYAHTADSLTKLYQAFPDKRKICVLGNTGGGRDIWKRKEMGKVADDYCDEIILTNEDPYDDDPEKIVLDMKVGMIKKVPEIIMDRREAIAQAIKKADAQSVVLITGKGTDPYIMVANGQKIPWSDRLVAEEEIKKIV